MHIAHFEAIIYILICLPIKFLGESPKSMVFLFESMVDEFWNLNKEEELKTPTNQKMAKWTKPPSGWLKINTNASFKDGTVGLAIVVRDKDGFIIYLASKIKNCEALMKLSF